MDASDRVAGLAGDALQFDGLSSYVSATTLGSLGSDSCTQDFTLQAWVRSTNAAARQTLLGSIAGGALLTLDIHTGAGNSPYIPDRLRTQVRDGSGVYLVNASDTTTLSDAGWHLVTMAVDTTSEMTTSYYFDGALVATIDDPTTATNLSGCQNYIVPAFIGAQNNGGTPGWFFEGTLDEVRMSNVARSAEWARLSYENQRAGQTFVTCE